MAGLARVKWGHRVIAVSSHWLGVVAGLAVLFGTLLAANSDILTVFRYFSQGIGLFAFFSGLLFSSYFGWIHVALELRPMRWIGRISYALYLWHVVALSLWFAVLGDEVANPTRWGALIASFAAAAFSFHMIETRFFALRRHFGASVRTGRLPNPE